MPRQALRWSHPSRRRDGPGYAAEGDIVDLAVRVVALEGARVGLGFGVTCGISTHCGGKIGVREDLGDVRIESCHGDRPGRNLADALSRRRPRTRSGRYRPRGNYIPGRESVIRIRGSILNLHRPFEFPVESSSDTFLLPHPGSEYVK